MNTSTAISRAPRRRGFILAMQERIGILLVCVPLASIGVFLLVATALSYGDWFSVLLGCGAVAMGAVEIGAAALFALHDANEVDE